MFPDGLNTRQRRWTRIASSLLFARGLQRRVRLLLSELIRFYLFGLPILGFQSPSYYCGEVIASRLLQLLRTDGANYANEPHLTATMVAGMVWLRLVTLGGDGNSFVGKLWFFRFPREFVSRTSFGSLMGLTLAVSQIGPRLLPTLLRMRFQLQHVGREACIGIIRSYLDEIEDWRPFDWWFGYAPFVRITLLKYSQGALKKLCLHAICLMVLQQLLGSYWVPSVLPWNEKLSWLPMAQAVYKTVWQIRDEYRRFQPRSRLGPKSPPPDPPPIYKYDALSPDKDTIRLLLVHPRHRHDPISCTLFEAELGRGLPRYEAVSYRWADDGTRRQISINGCSFHVMSNVYEMLQDFRWRLFPRLLWIDSICIDQNPAGDLSEKSRQVAMMDRIYASASLVTVWLGSPSMPRCKELVQDIHRRLRKDAGTRPLFGKIIGIDLAGDTNPIVNIDREHPDIIPLTGISIMCFITVQSEP